jgi:hypothetical protein
LSAIGSVVILERDDFAQCVRLAGAIRTERKGWGPFKSTVTLGREAFDQAWHAAIVSETDFAFSGYVLGDYLTAQKAVNGFATEQLEESAAARALNKVFTAAIPIEQPIVFPGLQDQPLRDFSATEYGGDADGMFEAIQGADEFYRRAMERLGPDHVAIFLIR